MHREIASLGVVIHPDPDVHPGRHVDTVHRMDELLAVPAPPTQIWRGCESVPSRRGRPIPTATGDRPTNRRMPGDWSFELATGSRLRNTGDDYQAED
ncbi:ribosome-binding factor A domain protein [Mycobacterium ulcerans str. Harvey]|uniref:Ribosome-binding factor A domain protein n=1 Tax=Mycobacterium ulcerans str. Harvey TaxID=1299332 RepID=A0ABN0RB38_MYCUL|nr:ribosome-binding factor A domain protein [Mycobacterium ulcerans str. Harvey]